jgi:two-component system phosphate regulon sensor histidine kinase PhoR
LRHLAVAVLVVVVVNMQLTWWIIFVLRENRARLRLERQLLLTTCERVANDVATDLLKARTDLIAALGSGTDPRGSGPPYPFASWQLSEADGCPDGWRSSGDGLVLVIAARSGCLQALAEPAWRDAVLAIGEGVEIVPATAPDVGDLSAAPPTVALPPPFVELSVRPLPEAWSEILHRYRARIVMIVSEGTFFAVLLFVLIALLVRTLRREAELERRHRNFLSAVTHELKSPLASVRLALETVLSGRASGPDGERFLGNAMRDAERLQDLVQKVLEVTRYDRGGGGLEFRQSHLSGVVEEVIESFCRRAHPLGAQVDAELDDDIWVDLNEEAFGIVVSNLLENAVKYGGHAPRIGVRLRYDHGRALLEVSDNGSGIPDDELPFVFDRFFRGGDEMTRSSNGTGLGLYLVKQIVAAHRGTVIVASTGRDGTTFRVTLPHSHRKETRS